MRMHNPPHPGEILSEFWLTPLGLSIHEPQPASMCPTVRWLNW